MSKFFKSKKFSLGAKEAPAQPEPRKMEEINKEWSDLMAKVSVEQYKVVLHKRNTDYYNERLLQLTEEANKRTAIDAEVAKSTQAVAQTEQQATK